ncbi:MAG: rod shape-determining protein RodA [Bacteroidales bacterium]|nr:rod shape-determining protein RodA [Bacteroidales bacterium]MBQ9172299.1 rod shape-determining protein RodA [Bacteroidales bacterium]MBQ9175125.1 rod shape-determining protein RodA [Bacteroidales bacterium]MBQ9712136.1 rod shape-determining protein RodA [Bacteroidales bacterium]MBR1436389.1 rod shape-determining protein RodA [Bacteroidales bacterium]
MDNTFKGRSMKQSFDWKLVIIYLLLVIIGWVNIYASVHTSAGTSILDWSLRSGKQFVWILTSLGLAGLILFVLPPRIWESASIPLYVGVLFLLVAVIFLGVEVKGSRSWFEFGPVRFQPAEVSKITTSLLLAFVMSRPNYKITEMKSLVITALVIGIPMLIILGESETGSALVYVGFIFMLYREGLSGWFIGAIGLVILLFIMTLTTNPYTSVLAAIGILSFCAALNTGRIGRWLLIYGSFILVMSFFPIGWKFLTDSLIPGASIINEVDPMVQDAIRGASKWSFLLKIKPLYILILIGMLAVPVYVIRSYREKDQFLFIAAMGFIASVILVFSTDFIFNNVLQDHQRKRIEVLLGMKEDPSGVGYNVNQSMIAIGSGGLLGKGYLRGTQTAYGFVPEQSTDFIFCTVGEEWGFVGCAVVIILYVLMIWRIIHDAERSRESFTRIYGYCVACCLFMHLFINIGMTIGLMPVIGIPLPLMSYGGSSLWAFTILLSIFIVLDHEEKKYF